MYEIHRVTRFNEKLDALKANFDRLDEAIEMMEILLRSKPERGGFVIGVEDARFIRTKPFPGVPKLIIFYRIDENNKTVYLLQADQCAENGDQE